MSDGTQVALNQQIIIHFSMWGFFMHIEIKGTVSWWEDVI